MYHLPECREKPTAYMEIPLYQRIREITLFHSLKFKVAVYITKYFNTSTFRYRAANMCEALKSSKKWHGVYFCEEELEVLKRYIDQVDLIIVVRYRYSELLAEFMNQAERMGVSRVFDIDDLVFNPKHQGLIKQTIITGKPTEHQNNVWAAETRGLYKTAELCEGFIATNNILKEQLEYEFDKPGITLRNFYNYEQDNISKYYAGMKNGEDRTHFLIGYFSGTNVHDNDFAVLADDLGKWMQDYPDTKLKIGGYLTLPVSYRQFEEQGRIIRVPFMDYVKLQREIAECDLNLIPLQNNLFTNCKSELKYFEAAIVKTISIASPTHVFKQCIQDGKNGYLAQEDWYEKIKLYYELTDEGRENLKCEVLNAAIERYAFFNQNAAIERGLDGFAK